MIAKCLLSLGLLACLGASAVAQDAAERQRAALPFVIEQRNNAFDSAALCQGDLAAVQNQLAALRKELAAAHAEITQLKTKPESSQ